MYTQTINGYEKSYSVLYDNVNKTIPIYENLINTYPDDPEYLLYLGSTYGIQARVALATKNWIQVIYSGYKGYSFTHKAHQINPDLKDAFMPIGLMEFYSCMASPPVKIAAKVLGIAPDCEKGILHLQYAVNGGGYSRIEASNALTYIYLYFLNDPNTALKYITPISDEHPENPFFAALKGEALARSGNFIDLDKFYPHLELLSQNGPFLQRNETELKIKYIRAIESFSNNDIQSTIEFTSWIIDNYHMEFDWLLGKAHLLRGKCYDLLDNRDKAVKDYKITTKLENYFPDSDKAKKLIKKPYSGKDVFKN